MATKVNTKFIIILGSVLVVVFAGVAIGGYMHYQGRGEREVAKADQLLAQGQIEEASLLYERAVGRDRTNIEWLRKWRTSLEMLVPEDQRAYVRQYDFYRNILRQMALLQRTDVDLQLEYLDEIWRFVRTGETSRAGLEFIVDQAEDRTSGFSEGTPEEARILRYRGLAMVERMGTETLMQDEQDQTLTDLQRAVEVDPEDWECKLGLVRWQLADANRIRREGQSFRADSALKSTRDALDALLAENPDQPETLLFQALFERNESARTVVGIEGRQQLTAEFAEDVARVVERVSELPPEALRTDFLERLAGTVLIGSRGEPTVEATLAMLERSLEVEPDNARLALLRGKVFEETQRYDEALAQYEVIIQLPDRPISLDGLLLEGRRQQALAFQTDTALRRWATMPAGSDEASEALALVEEYRDKLSERIDVQQRQLILIRDAKIAMARGEYGRAVRELADLRNLPEGQTNEVRRLLVQALELQGNAGEAKRIVEELIELTPTNGWAHGKLGDLSKRLAEFDQAIASYSIARELDPANAAYYDRQIRDLQAVQGDSEAVASEDPVIQTIITSRELRSEDQFEDAIATLQAGADANPDDPRLPRELIRALVQSERIDEALTIARDAASRFPDSPDFEQSIVLLENRDPNNPAVAQLELINQSDLAEREKSIERFKIYTRFGMEQEARAELASLEQQWPDDPSVLDASFVLALEDDDLATARQVAQRAAATNADNCDGLLFQARIQLHEERNIEAVQTLESAAQRLPFSPDLRRLMGRAYSRVGRVADALDSYERAYEGRRTDPINAIEYARALLAANRGRQALEVVSPDSGGLRYNPSNMALVRLWLQLEAQYGDRDVAIRARTNRLRQDPTDAENVLGLARLHIEDGNYDAANQVIDAFEAIDGVEPIAGAILRARILAESGDVDAGREVLVQCIADVEADPDASLSPDYYIALGEFLFRYEEAESGVAALRKARDYQDPETRLGDRRLGDHWFDTAAAAERQKQIAGSSATAEPEQIAELEQQMISAYEKAVESYSDALQSMPEDDEIAQRVRKRTVETLLKLGRVEEAEQALAPLVSRTPDDKQVLGLRAMLAEAEGDRRTARSMLNRAVELYRNDARLFFQRALFNAKEPSLVTDAIQDLTQATNLSPSLIEAWSKRYELVRDGGDMDEALGVLRQGVDANPDNDNFRLYLLRELARAGRIEEAQEEALRVARSRPNDATWLELTGRVMAGFQRWNEAAELFRQLYTLRQDINVARALLDSMLRSTVNRDLRLISEVLRDFENEFEPSLGDYMLRARALTAINEIARAKRYIESAMAILGDSGVLGRFFNEQLQLAMGGNIGQVLLFLDEVEDQSLLQNPLLRVARVYGRFRVSGPSTELIAELDSMDPDSFDDITRSEYYRSLAQISFALQNYERAAQSYELAIEVQPNDIQMLNDLAFILMQYLGEVDRGIEFAQRAVEGPSANAAALDTLGWGYYLKADYDEAITIFERAKASARSPETSFVANLHLGLAQAKAGQVTEARRSLREAESDGDRATMVRDSYMGELEELRELCR